jgi:hypothetical protein
LPRLLDHHLSRRPLTLALDHRATTGPVARWHALYLFPFFSAERTAGCDRPALGFSDFGFIVRLNFLSSEIFPLGFLHNRLFVFLRI